jgi:hypothetical protein
VERIEFAQKEIVFLMIWQQLIIKMTIHVRKILVKTEESVYLKPYFIFAYVVEVLQARPVQIHYKTMNQYSKMNHYS